MDEQSTRERADHGRLRGVRPLPRTYRHRPPPRSLSPPRPGVSGVQGYPSAPRGPRRSGAGGPGARAAAERFGLNWDTAAPAVLAVAAEASARVPQEWEIEGPGVSLSLGDAADLDPDAAGGGARPGRPRRPGARPAVRAGPRRRRAAARPGPGRAGRAGRRRRRVPHRRPTDRRAAGRPATGGPRRSGSRRRWSRSTPAAAPPSSPTPGPAVSRRAAAPGSSPTTSSRPSC